MAISRDFRGIFIPREIWLDKTLSMTEKCLLMEIDSLDVDGGGCFASNTYLAEFLGASEKTVSRGIKVLSDRGLIAVESKKTKIGTDRIMRSKVKNPLVKMSTPPGQNVQDPTGQNVPHSINPSLGNLRDLGEKNPQTPKGDSTDLFTDLPKTTEAKTNKAEETAKEVLEYLNEKTNSRFRTFKGCGLLALIREGRTMEDFKAVIDFKVLEWAENPKMSAYLTPQTLFRAGNFDKYLAMAEKAKASGGAGLALYRDPDQKALADALEGAFLSRIPSGFPNPAQEREAIGWLVSAIWKQWPQEAFTAGGALVTSFYGLTQTGNTFMRSQPFLPSRMRALYLDVVKACEMAAPPAYDAHREAIMRDLERAGT